MHGEKEGKVTKLTAVTNVDEGGSGMEFSELGGSRRFRAAVVASAGLSECERERGRQQGRWLSLGSLL